VNSNLLANVPFAYAVEHLSLADAVFEFGHDGAVQQTTTDFRELSRDSKLLKWLKQRPEESTTENTAQETEAQVPVAASGPSNDAGPGRQNADFSLYTYYLKASGPGTIILWLLVLAMTVVGDRMPGEEHPLVAMIGSVTKFDCSNLCADLGREGSRQL
jgi:hypothetical protein